MIQQLVVNGCSYNEVYSNGPGPIQLASDLGIKNRVSIALGGSNNSRILRTTIKHSYQTTVPSLYIVGLTFMNRWELPVAETNGKRDFEGSWINPQSQKRADTKFIWGWSEQDTETFKDLMFKASVFAHADNLEDLMYRCIAIAADIEKRGHRILFWNNCDEAIPDLMQGSDRFKLLKHNKIFVDALTWVAIPWQHKQGATPSQYAPGSTPPPDHLKHILPEDYKYLNGYLTQWIKDNKILE